MSISTEPAGAEYICYREQMTSPRAPWARLGTHPARRTYFRTRIEVASADEQSEHDEGRLLLTVDEAAQILRISRWKLYDYIRSRELRTIKFGTRRLVPVSALQALIDRLGDEESL